MSQHQPMTSLIAIIEWSSGRPPHRYFEPGRQQEILFFLLEAVVLLLLKWRWLYIIATIYVSSPSSWRHLRRFRCRADSVNRLPAATYVAISRDALHHLGWSSCFLLPSTRQSLDASWRQRQVSTMQSSSLRPTDGRTCAGSSELEGSGWGVRGQRKTSHAGGGIVIRSRGDELKGRRCGYRSLRKAKGLKPTTRSWQSN